ncbi:MAG TPA: hypothetical protein VG013_42455, partial [Gemmataceae bacterium]|nr:hypothetical protein [Gemmataceae bacterium]
TEGLSQAFTLGSFTDPSGGPCHVDVNWGDGTPDTTFSTSTLGSLGTATHTFAEEGNQRVTVTVTNGVNLSAAASFQVAVGDAGLAATPQAIAATAGGPFNGVAASFIDANPQATAGEFAATIHWGDGGTSVGTVAANGNGGFDVTGGHTYAAAGAEAVTVQITDVGGSTLTAASTAQVVDPGWRVARGQSSTVRFWHSHHGQALIDSFNGGPDSTALAGWLATTFPNLYGANAGAYDLTGQTNAQVAAFYQSLYHAHGRRLEADVLDTALDVYATTTSLGGPDAAQYGFVVTDAGLGAASLNIRHSGAAFGVPNRTTLNVYQVLQAADQQAVNGVLYNGNTHLDCLADGVFDRIDRAGHIW